MYHGFTALLVDIFGEYNVAQLSILDRGLLECDCLDLMHTEGVPDQGRALAILSTRIGGAPNLRSYCDTLRAALPAQAEAAAGRIRAALAARQTE